MPAPRAAGLRIGGVVMSAVIDCGAKGNVACVDTLRCVLAIFATRLDSRRFWGLQRESWP